MSFTNLLSRMAKSKYKAFTEKKVKPVVTPTPLKLHQGSAIEVSAVATILVEAAGGLMPQIDPTQTVVAVGKFQMFGFDVYRSYLSDGKSFIQTVADKADPSKAVECRFYTTHMEQAPASQADWDFLLADADGYIGYPWFDLGDINNGGTRYLRMWSPGDGRIDPVDSRETVTEADGDVLRVRHRMMQYGRKLGTDASAPSEYLIAAAVETDDGATFDLWIGIDLEPSTLAVYGAATV